MKDLELNKGNASLDAFKEDFGEVKGFRIIAADIQKWCDSLVADGISRSTIGMYLRAFRVAFVMMVLLSVLNIALWLIIK